MTELTTPRLQPPPQQFINPQTGQLTQEATLWLQANLDGKDPRTPVGSVLSGFNQTSNQVSGLVAENDAVANSDMAGSGDLTLTLAVNPLVTQGSGSTTSPNANLTIGGGVGPYTVAWARQSGDTEISISSASAEDPAFDATVSDGQYYTATWRATVTDSTTPTALTGTIDLVVSIYSVTQF